MQIVRSWDFVRALLVPFVHLWAPQREEGGTEIPAVGYEWVHAMVPHRRIHGIRDLEILVARDQKQWDDYRPWLEKHNEVFGLNQSVPIIMGFRSDVSYFDQLRSHPPSMRLIQNRVRKGAFFRPYEFDHLMGRDAESFGFPPSQWYNYVQYNERLERELSPDAALRESQFPVKMCFTREVAHDADEVGEQVEKLRRVDKYHGPILLELEARAGRVFSALVGSGEMSNPKVEHFLAEHSQENILVRPWSQKEMEWSVQYESGEGGAIRRYGLHRKRYAIGEQGQPVKSGSIVGFDTLPGIPRDHLKQGLYWADRLACKLYAQKTGPCSLGIIYLSFPGEECPLYVRINDRDDAEVILHKLLERIFELTGEQLFGAQDRLFFYEHSWRDLAQRLQDELWTPERKEGGVLHVPYKDMVRSQQLGREVRTVYYVQVGPNPGVFEEHLKRVKEKIGAWGQGEAPKTT